MWVINLPLDYDAHKRGGGLGLTIYSKSFEMTMQHAYTKSSFNIGWMRGTLVYNTSLPP